MSKTDLENIFDNIEKARASRNSNWIAPGHYLYRINKIKTGTNRTDENFLCVEMTILHVYEGEQKVCEEISHMLWEKHKDNFLPNVKSMIASICGCEEDVVTAESCARVSLNDGSEDAQPLAGVCVETLNKLIATKAGKDFTKVHYKRAVPYKELLGILSEDNKNMLFPGGELDTLAANEKS